MHFVGIKTQIAENSGPSVKICRLGLKSKTVRGVARWYWGGARPARPYLPIVFGLQCNRHFVGQWYLVFRRVPLFSRDASHLAWIVLTFDIISSWEILNLSCGSCVVGHFLCRMIGVYQAASWWYSEFILIFALRDLGLAFLSGAFLLLSISSQDIPATWSRSDFCDPAISCATVMFFTAQFFNVFFKVRNTFSYDLDHFERRDANYN
jgi:hypothetical protein